MGLKSTKFDELDERRVTVSARESTSITGLGLPATYKLIKAGVIPSIKVGNRYLIPVALLAEALGEAARSESEKLQRLSRRQNRERTTQPTA